MPVTLEDRQAIAKACFEIVINDCFRQRVPHSSNFVYYKLRLGKGKRTPIRVFPPNRVVLHELMRLCSEGDHDGLCQLAPKFSALTNANTLNYQTYARVHLFHLMLDAVLSHPAICRDEKSHSVYTFFLNDPCLEASPYDTGTHRDNQPATEDERQQFIDYYLQLDAARPMATLRLGSDEMSGHMVNHLLRLPLPGDIAIPAIFTEVLFAFALSSILPRLGLEKPVHPLTFVFVFFLLNWFGSHCVNQYNQDVHVHLLREAHFDYPTTNYPYRFHDLSLPYDNNAGLGARLVALANTVELRAGVLVQLGERGLCTQEQVQLIFERNDLTLEELKVLLKTILKSPAPEQYDGYHLTTVSYQVSNIR